MQYSNTQSFAPRPPSARDLTLLPELTRRLTAKGWTSLRPWAGGLRAQGRVRHAIFGVLHVKHQKTPRRRALVREATLRLLEERARGQLADELVLVTDGDIDSESHALLSSAGIDWLDVPASTGKLKRVVVGLKGKKKPGSVKGPKSPWATVGPIRGASGSGRPRGVLGAGTGLVRVRLRFSGSVDLDLPGVMTVVAKDDQHQNGVLIVRVRARVGVDLVVDFFCLNRDAAPSGPKVMYELGPLIEHEGLAALVALLDSRDVANAAARKVVQDAVWELFEDNRLESETEAALQALPQGVDE